MSLKKINAIFQSKASYERYIYLVALNESVNDQWKSQFESLKSLNKRQDSYILKKEDLRKLELNIQASIYDKRFEEDLLVIESNINDKIDAPATPEVKIKYLKEKIDALQKTGNLIKNILINEYQSNLLNDDHLLMKKMVSLSNLLYGNLENPSSPRLVSELPDELIKLGEIVIKNTEKIEGLAIEILKSIKDEDFYIQTLQLSYSKVKVLISLLLLKHSNLIKETGYELRQTDDDFVLTQGLNVEQGLIIEQIKTEQKKSENRLKKAQKLQLEKQHGAIKSLIENKQKVNATIEIKKKGKEIVKKNSEFLSDNNQDEDGAGENKENATESLIKNTLEDFEEKLNDKKKFNAVVNALTGFFEGTTPKIKDPISTPSIRKNKLGKALGEIHFRLAEENVTLPYLLFLRNLFKCFSKEKIDEKAFRTSNLYKYTSTTKLQAPLLSKKRVPTL